MKLMEYLTSTSKEVSELFTCYYGDQKTELSKASYYLLEAEGKRLRPAMFKLAAESVTPGSSNQIMSGALAVEVTHTFTLVHDDIMDDDSLRRGRPTVHVVWNEPTAILAGDVLFARAFVLLADANADPSRKVEAVRILGKASEDICEGQQSDMAFEARDDVSADEYLEMVRKKTGVLYGTAGALGALLAGASPEVVSAFMTFGEHLGIAFQIQDDIIDLTRETAVSGKDQASDIREGKQTLIAIRAREKGIDLTPYQRNLSSDEIQEIITLLTEAGIIADITAEAQAYIDSGVACLSILPDSQEKELLLDVAQFFIQRAY
ncbi:MAG: polyprenyl synthetase family protein [Methanomicrobiales archaeon]|jgi:geranylgeranyl diphosphate synthase type I|nr:polyprenyl synthetase family protein [Methanomicrobiales archaeon]